MGLTPQGSFFDNNITKTMPYGVMGQFGAPTVIPNPDYRTLLTSYNYLPYVSYDQPVAVARTTVRGPIRSPDRVGCVIVITQGDRDHHIAYQSITEAQAAIFQLMREGAQHLP